jgi:hypothetical protein
LDALVRLISVLRYDRRHLAQRSALAAPVNHRMAVGTDDGQVHQRRTASVGSRGKRPQVVYLRVFPPEGTVGVFKVERTGKDFAPQASRCSQDRSDLGSTQPVLPLSVSHEKDAEMTFDGFL